MKKSELRQMVREEIQKLSELSFQTPAEFQEYKKQHKMRPDTKVTIAGYTTTVGKQEKSQAKMDTPISAKKAKLGDSVHNSTENLTGIIVNKAGNTITVLTTDGRRTWDANDPKIEKVKGV
jgi:hypothetical protein